jgi:hypothetical protein
MVCFLYCTSFVHDEFAFLASEPLRLTQLAVHDYKMPKSDFHTSTLLQSLASACLEVGTNIYLRYNDTP